MITISDLIEREHGHRNWVVARRSPHIFSRYSVDVICLSQKAYAIYAKNAELENAVDHPAYGWLKTLFGNHCDAVNIIRGLREAGFRIEHIGPKEAP